MDGFLPILSYGVAEEEDSGKEEEAEEGSGRGGAAERATDDSTAAAARPSPTKTATAPDPTPATLVPVPLRPPLAVKNRRTVARPRAAASVGGRPPVGADKRATALGDGERRGGAKGGTEGGKGERQKERKVRVAAGMEDELLPDRRAALEAVSILLEGERLTRAEVMAAARALSSEDMVAMAEERALTGKCGNPACSNPHSHVPGRERQRISLGQRKMYRQFEPAGNFCSAACEAALLSLAIDSLAMSGHESTVPPPAPPPVAPSAPLAPEATPVGGGGGGGGGDGGGAAAEDTGRRSAGGVKENQIMAAAIVEKLPQEVSRDSAAGLMDCLTREAAVSGAAAQREVGILGGGAVEGFVPRAVRERVEEARKATTAAPPPRPAATAAAVIEELPAQEGSGGEAAADQTPAPARKFKPNVPTVARRKEAAAGSGGKGGVTEVEASGEVEDDIDFDFGEGWFSAIDAVPELSSFGQLHTTLYNWVTVETQRHLMGRPLQECDGAGVAAAESWPRVKEGMRMQMDRQLLPLLQALGALSVPRRAAEGELEALLATLHCATALPSFKVREWRLVLLIFLRAMSHQRLPTLQPVFTGDAAMATLHKLLTSLGSDMYEFDILHDVVYPFS